MYSREPRVARARLGPLGMRQAMGGAEERGRPEGLLARPL